MCVLSRLALWQVNKIKYFTTYVYIYVVDGGSKCMRPVAFVHYHLILLLFICKHQLYIYKIVRDDDNEACDAAGDAVLYSCIGDGTV